MEEKRQPESIDVDFDLLVKKVKQMSEREGQILLWTEVFKLSKWHFITKHQKDSNDIRPFIGEVDGKSWFYVFTDSRHASEFAQIQGFVVENGVANTIAMKPLDATEWINKHLELGVFGVRFNEGEHGWFAPITNLLPMYQYLKDLKTI